MENEIYFNRNKSPIFPELYDGRLMFLGDVRKHEVKKDPRTGVMMVQVILRFSQEYRDFYHDLLNDTDRRSGFTILVCKETDFVTPSKDPLYPRMMVLKTCDGHPTWFSRQHEFLRLQVEEQQKLIDQLATSIAIQTAETSKWLKYPQQTIKDWKLFADSVGVTSVKYIARDGEDMSDPLLTGDNLSGGIKDATSNY